VRRFNVHEVGGCFPFGVPSLCLAAAYRPGQQRPVNQNPVSRQKGLLFLVRLNPGNEQSNHFDHAGGVRCARNSEARVDLRPFRKSGVGRQRGIVYQRPCHTNVFPVCSFRDTERFYINAGANLYEAVLHRFSEFFAPALLLFFPGTRRRVGFSSPALAWRGWLLTDKVF